MSGTDFCLVGHDGGHVLGRLRGGGQRADDLHLLRRNILTELLLQGSGVNGVIPAVASLYLTVQIVCQPLVVRDAQVCHVLLHVADGHLLTLSIGGLLLQLCDCGLERPLLVLQCINTCLQVLQLNAPGIQFKTFLR